MNARMDSTDDAIGNGAMRNSLFLNNLEQWIDDIISQNGLADKELIKTIKERFQRSMQANIEHHQCMIKSANENDDQASERRHKLMVSLQVTAQMRKNTNDRPDQFTLLVQDMQGNVLVLPRRSSS